MRGRPAPTVACACTLLLASAGLARCSARPSSGTPRHVVLISLDTTRADHFGFYGNRSVATPNLDRLAAESIVLQDFMTVAPTTLTSHASLFTGNYPHTHGTPRNGFVVHPDNLTLAEILAEHGYVTAGFVGSFALAGRFGIDQGFDLYDEEFDRQAGEAGRLQNERSAASVTDAVIEYLDRSGVPEHLLLFAHYFDPHVPYAAPPPYDTMYDARGREGLPGWHAVSQECSLRGAVKTPDGERLAQQYAGEISYMDQHVGRLLDTLRERGILENAVVVVTSDHGEDLWEHPVCFDHGWTTYQTAIRAVGLLRLPGKSPAGRRIEELAANIDILPTLLELLGIPPLPGLDGRPIDLGNRSPRAAHTRFGQATKPWEAVETDSRWTNMLKARFIREGTYKFIQVPYRNQEELYDLARDPDERTNLIDSDSPEIIARVRELRGKLEEWAAAARPLPPHFDDQQRDDTIERLRALGYL